MRVSFLAGRASLTGHGGGRSRRGPSSIEGGYPQVVAETVVKAATAAVPRRRYTAGKLARQVRFLRRFVPESAFDKSLRKQNNLPV